MPVTHFFWQENILLFLISTVHSWRVLADTARVVGYGSSENRRENEHCIRQICHEHDNESYPLVRPVVARVFLQEITEFQFLLMDKVVVFI